MKSLILLIIDTKKPWTHPWLLYFIGMSHQQISKFKTSKLVSPTHLLFLPLPVSFYYNSILFCSQDSSQYEPFKPKSDNFSKDSSIQIQSKSSSGLPSYSEWTSYSLLFCYSPECISFSLPLVLCFNHNGLLAAPQPCLVQLGVKTFALVPHLGFHSFKYLPKCYILLETFLTVLFKNELPHPIPSMACYLFLFNLSPYNVSPLVILQVLPVCLSNQVANKYDEGRHFCLFRSLL